MEHPACSVYSLPPPPPHPLLLPSHLITQFFPLLFEPAVRARSTIVACIFWLVVFTRVLIFGKALFFQWCKKKNNKNICEGFQRANVLVSPISTPRLYTAPFMHGPLLSVSHSFTQHFCTTLPIHPPHTPHFPRRRGETE